MKKIKHSAWIRTISFKLKVTWWRQCKTNSGLWKLSSFEKSGGNVGGEIVTLLIKQKSDVEKERSELRGKIQKREKRQFTSKHIREQDVFKSFTAFLPLKFDILF